MSSSSALKLAQKYAPANFQPQSGHHGSGGGCGGCAMMCCGGGGGGCSCNQQPNRHYIIDQRPVRRKSKSAPRRRQSKVYPYWGIPVDPDVQVQPRTVSVASSRSNSRPSLGSMSTMSLSDSSSGRASSSSSSSLSYPNYSSIFTSSSGSGSSSSGDSSAFRRWHAAESAQSFGPEHSGQLYASMDEMSDSNIIPHIPEGVVANNVAVSQSVGVNMPGGKRRRVEIPAAMREAAAEVGRQVLQLLPTIPEVAETVSSVAMQQFMNTYVK